MAKGGSLMNWTVPFVQKGHGGNSTSSKAGVLLACRHCRRRAGNGVSVNIQRKRILGARASSRESNRRPLTRGPIRQSSPLDAHSSDPSPTMVDQRLPRRGVLGLGRLGPHRLDRCGCVDTCPMASIAPFASACAGAKGIGQVATRAPPATSPHMCMLRAFTHHRAPPEVISVQCRGGQMMGSSVLLTLGQQVYVI
jgi:hypothetical protein